MKVTVVPAQVTTVEDKITDRLGLSQLLLLAAPIFIGSGVYIVFPPVMHSAGYKLISITLIFLLCGALAIRIKGKLLLSWLITLLRYNLRPRYYVFDKRSLHGREDYRRSVTVALIDEPVQITQKVRETLQLTPADVIHLQDVINNPAAQLSFKTNRKGGLYVHITEVK